MKGLVFKDLLLMKKMNKKVIFVMYFFVIAISFFGENEVYSIMSSAFFSLFIGMHLMMTMTYDGLTSWKQYELTLPMSKYQIIFSKYLTSLLLVPISIMGTVIIYIIRYVVYHNFTLSQFGFSIAIAIALPVLWCSICLAIAQWFGYMSVQYDKNLLLFPHSQSKQLRIRLHENIRDHHPISPDPPVGHIRETIEHMPCKRHQQKQIQQPKSQF